MRLADAIVVPTDYLVEVFRKHGITASAIANHVEAGALTYRARTSISPRILSNRNFELHYNVAAVLEAFRIVQRQYTEAELIVVGNGSLREELQALAKKLELSNVTFTGPVKPETMARYYDDADVFVNASLIDNMPLQSLRHTAPASPW